ncbi:MAG: hypothetical protein FJ161_01740 [Gammaproteobacteria bacterium]|nr:hypothetical protein [Gammaproteobacteria bacterium]
MQVWVSPTYDLNAPVAPIGGDQARYAKWYHAVEALCTRAKHYQKDVSFQLELVVDRRVYQEHSRLREHWETLYGDLIKWTLWTDSEFMQHNTFWKEGIEQCRVGCASVCSDFLRGRLLYDRVFDHNIYMDVDTFSEAFANRLLLRSDRVLGANCPEGSIASTFHATPKFVSWNGDLITALHPSLLALDYIDIRSQQILQEHSQLYHHIATRPLRSKMQWDEYQKTINELVEYSIQHPKTQMNEYGLILGGIGPGLWFEMMERGIVQPYHDSHVDGMQNYFSWREGATLPSNFQSYETLSKLYGPDAAAWFLKLNFYLYDYFSMRKNSDRAPQWLSQLKSECQKCWREIELLGFNERLMKQEACLYFSLSELGGVS